MAIPSSYRHTTRLPGLLSLSLLIVSVLFIAPAQEIRSPDSLNIALPDSLRVPRGRSTFIPSIGNLRSPLDSSDRMHSAQFMRSDATYIGDLLRTAPGLHLREFGQPGLPPQLTARGEDGRSIALLIDGRPMRDPISGSVNLYALPIEFLDEIEILNRPASAFSASNSAGGTVNLVSRQYDNIRPLTKLRFMQGPFEQILTDGLFTQNIRRGMNAMVGFQRQVSDGRFTNSAYDSWNVRARVRYNISEALNIWASDLYHRATTGLNDGIDPTRSPSLYDEVTAVVRDESSVQTVSRHDFTLGIAGRLLADSTSLSRALAYYSSIERELSTGGTPFSPPAFSDLQSSSVWGTRIEQRLQFPATELKLGAEFERRIVDQGHFLSGRSEDYASAAGLAAIVPFDWLSVQLGARFETLRSDKSFSWSARGDAVVTHGISLWGEVSRSFRHPSIQELFWTDSTISRIGALGKELHSVAELGIRIEAGPVWISAAGFGSRVVDAVGIQQKGTLHSRASVVISALSPMNVAGVTVDAQVQLWRFAFAANLMFLDRQRDGGIKDPYPQFSSFTELSYHDIFGDNVLDLKAALRARSMTRHFGNQFDTRLFEFTRQTSSEMPGFSSVDFYAVAKFGDAFVTFVWENPLNSNGMVVPYYPLPGRNIKFGVNWIFTD